MRRLVTMASLAYLIVAFGFILLILLNAADEGEIVAIGESDAGAIIALCVVGMFVTFGIGLRILVDSKQRHDLERIVREPRRKSDVVARRTQADETSSQ